MWRYVYLKIDEDTHVIRDIKFQTYGCAANIATTSIMTEKVKDKTLEEAKTITLNESFIRSRLRHVIHPTIGRDWKNRGKDRFI